MAPSKTSPQKAGIKPTGWSIGGAWFDSDNDGDLDLFIVNYCVWNPATEPFCGDKVAGYRTYCHPKYYAGLPNNLYRNNGDGTFTDISGEAGISGKIGKGMAVAVADYNGDGRTDLFVTNDTTPNFLFLNQGGNRFTEAGLAAGVAVVDDGKILSSMGAGSQDFDDDGRPDIFLTALTNETFPLFRNLGNGLFQEVTYKSRIGAASLQQSGWSFGIFDFDNDGWKDIFVANGDVQDNTEIYSSRRSKQQNQLFLNKGDGTFNSVLFGPARQHRGTAFGDFDGDGLVDAAVTTLDGPVELWRNRHRRPPQVAWPRAHRRTLQSRRHRRKGAAIGRRAHSARARVAVWRVPRHEHEDALLRPGHPRQCRLGRDHLALRRLAAAGEPLRRKSPSRH